MFLLFHKHISLRDESCIGKHHPHFLDRRRGLSEGRKHKREYLQLEFFLGTGGKLTKKEKREPRPGAQTTDQSGRGDSLRRSSGPPPLKACLRPRVKGPCLKAT